MPTVRDIAEATGVSPSTVSRALNNSPSVTESTRQRVLSAAIAAGWRETEAAPAPTPIGVIFAGEASETSHFDGAFLMGLVSQLDEFDMQLVVMNGRQLKREHTGSLTQMLEQRGVRGLVVRTNEHSRTASRLLSGLSLPVVVAADRTELPDMESIYSDSGPASREAIEHLISLGHTKVAVIVGRATTTDHTDRIDAYRAAMRAHGLEPGERFLMHTPTSVIGGKSALLRLIAMPDRPTAAFVLDPVVSVGMLTAAQENSVRVPGDLSLVGFDDTHLRTLTYPQMTAVCQDTRALARRCLSRLHELIAGPEHASHDGPAARLQTWFEVHGTSGSAPGHERTGETVSTMDQRLRADQ
ncbi:MAG: LacI family DNA-binding transcriptional regulator [Planctomycetota bacterium]